LCRCIAAVLMMQACTCGCCEAGLNPDVLTKLTGLAKMGLMGLSRSAEEHSDDEEDGGGGSQAARGVGQQQRGGGGPGGGPRGGGGGGGGRRRRRWGPITCLHSFTHCISPQLKTQLS
jgi:hypothetical protein